MNENYGDLEFAENADPRVPVVITLDCSDSMTQKLPGEDRAPLEALNGGLDVLFNELHRDELASRRAEVAFVPFGTVVGDPTPFSTVENLVLPDLQPMGTTSAGAALSLALDMIENRKVEYRANGIEYYRPILMLITDGLATDDTTQVAQRLSDMAAKKKVTFMPIAVEGADLNSLQSLSGKSPMKLSGIKFDELFQWLSASVQAVSASQPGDVVRAPAGIDEWAEL